MSNNGKTAKKTARSPLTGAEIPLGNHPGNTGGKKGRSGRKPDWFKQRCREALEREETWESIKRILDKPEKHAGTFASVFKHLADHAEGAPIQTHRLEAASPREKILDELAKRAARTKSAKSS